MNAGDETEFPPWLRPPLERLLALASAGQLPSGLLLTGPSGVGKGVLARAFMQRIACTRADDALLPCGDCNGCHAFLGGIHPEILEVTPEEAGKEILIEAIRVLPDFLGLSHSGPARLVFIEPAEAMTVNAANALLRTLEEPPGGAMILLSAARPARLPATIRSRCRLLRITQPPVETVRAWLGACRGSVMTPEEALAASLNRPLEALELIRDESAVENWRQDRAALISLLTQDSPFPTVTAFRQCALKSLIPRLQCLLLSAHYYLATGKHDDFGRLFDPVVLEGYARGLGQHELAQLSLESLRWQREADAPLNPELRCESMVLRLTGANA